MSSSALLRAAEQPVPVSPRTNDQLAGLAMGAAAVVTKTIKLGTMLTPVTSPVSTASTFCVSGTIRYLPRPMNSERIFSVSWVSTPNSVVLFTNAGMPMVLM